MKLYFLSPYKTNQTKPNNSITYLKMVAFPMVVLIIVCAQVVHSTTFFDENPIKQVVPDGLQELETSIVRLIGQTPHALTFARFAHRQLS
ncbi:putative cathepsin H [Helianthus debilis subsp. tardiflorus]